VLEKHWQILYTINIALIVAVVVGLMAAEEFLNWVIK